MKKFLEKLKNVKGVLFHALIPLMLAFTVQMLIGDYKPYLDSLNKPLEIPNIVFIIAWSVLYVLIGVSAYFIDQENKPQEMKIYYIQLIINLLYPVVFFYGKMIAIGALMTLTILAMSIYLLIRYYKIKKISFYLFIPYVLWLIFANYLQIGIYFLN